MMMLTHLISDPASQAVTEAEAAARCASSVQVPPWLNHCCWSVHWRPGASTLWSAIGSLCLGASTLWSAIRSLCLAAVQLVLSLLPLRFLAQPRAPRSRTRVQALLPVRFVACPRSHRTWTRVQPLLPVGPLDVAPKVGPKVALVALVQPLELIQLAAQTQLAAPAGQRQLAAQTQLAAPVGQRWASLELA